MIIYRWRLGLADGEPQYDDLEKRLAEAPVIPVPTMTLEGDANGAPHPDARAYAKQLAGTYVHRVITGGIGHNLPQEAPRALTEAVLEVDGYCSALTHETHARAVPRRQASRRGACMTTTMQAAQISQPGGEWEVVERDIPEPRAGHVRVKVEACGICHSDVFVKDGLWPGLQYPRVPGHEVAGRIDAVGDHVTAWQEGQRVGVGWHGGHCCVCDQCRRGDFAMCVHRKVTGIDFDGGYAEYIVAPVTALAAIPQALPAEEAGPFMCAGVTVYNALRHADARPGEVVAIHGIGGLGHLGVQYARQMGFETIAINRGNDKEPLARQLGAHHYIDASAQDVVTELQKLGGARVILATAPNAQAISALVDGLAASGTLVVPAAPAEPLTISVASLISGRRSVAGWYAGTARDAQDTLEFSALTGVHPMIETYPLHRVADAYEHMHSGRVRFRVVLTFEGVPAVTAQ